MDEEWEMDLCHKVDEEEIKFGFFSADMQRKNNDHFTRILSNLSIKQKVVVLNEVKDSVNSNGNENSSNCKWRQRQRVNKKKWVNQFTLNPWN